MRKLAAVILTLSLALPVIAHCQTTTTTPVWFTLNVNDGDTITATGPITLRYGQVASTCAVDMSSGPCAGVNPGTPSPAAWTNPITFTPAPGAPTVTIVVGAAAFGEDPLPGVYKTVQVEEQATAQNITVNGQSVTVPASSSSSPPTTTTSTWFTLNVNDGSTITATGPITLRYGQVASTCAVDMSTGPCAGVNPGAPSPAAWTNPITFTPAPGAPTVTIVVGAAAFGGDPLPGVYKTVQVLEQATAQNITVNGQSVTVPASSTTVCQLTATPSSIAFPNTTVGYSYNSSASIVNNCSTTIPVTTVQVTGPYSASGFQTPFSLAAGQTQNYTAVFTPTTTGTAAGSITFVSNATTGQTLSVSFSGTGVAPAQTGTGGHSVALTWQDSGSQIAGYNVYRSTVSGGPYSRINSTLVASTNYSDQTVAAGTTYYYVVTAVGTNGMESAYSSQTGVTVPSS